MKKSGKKGFGLDPSRCGDILVLSSEVEQEASALCLMGTFPPPSEHPHHHTHTHTTDLISHLWSRSTHCNYPQTSPGPLLCLNKPKSELIFFHQKSESKTKGKGLCRWHYSLLQTGHHPPPESQSFTKNVLLDPSLP